MDRMNDEVHDDLLFNMLQECKTLPVFMDHIFGFLNRRTDFYYETTERNSPVGLPPGYAEQIVRSMFYKWKNHDKMKSGEAPPPAIEEVEIESESCEVETVEDETQPDQSPPPPPPPVSVPKSEEKTINDFTSSECYNGAIYDTYSWSQNIKEVDIFIKVPDKIKTKDLVVKIGTDSISIKLKNGTVLLEGELRDKCKNNDAIWSLTKNKLEIHLDKCTELWWDCLLKSEPKLDVSKLDCSRPFEELPEEAQAKIEELQWNQQRKRLGLPTSEEMKMHSMLKQAWHAEGSPFSGPFDPTTVKFN